MAPKTLQLLAAWLETGRHLLVETVASQPRGLELATERFAEEGWLPLPRALRAEFDRYGRCTGCQACDVVCPLVKNANLLVFRGPMDVPLRILRRAPDLASERATLEVFDRCGSCHACESACPERIPILEVVAALRAVVATAEPAEAPPDGHGKSKSSKMHDPG